MTDLRNNTAIMLCVGKSKKLTDHHRTPGSDTSLTGELIVKINEGDQEGVNNLINVSMITFSGPNHLQ